MTVVVDFTAHRARHRAPRPIARGSVLDQLEAMDDAIEIAQDQMTAGRREVDVYADLWRAGVGWALANLGDTAASDEQARAALAALDRLHPNGSA
jgi:hypothetical protein